MAISNVVDHETGYENSVKNSKSLLDELETYYSYVLDSANLNIADPIAANVGYFNNSGKVFIDGPKLGRTLVYVTRPNMNFREKSNIKRCRAFNYIVSSKMGVTLARQLMFSRLAGEINYAGDKDLKFKCENTRHGVMVGTCGPYTNPGEKVATEKVGGMVIEETEVEDTKVDSLGNKKKSKVCAQSYPIDDTNFIPLLTNTCIETSNAKDIILEVDETEGDYSGNRMVYGAGIDDTMGPGEITLTFEDLYGSPVMNMMILWVYYIHYVTKGICVPEFKYIVNRIIDYTCSIYIFMLDTDQKTIIRWIKYCGCFPKSIPFGQILHTKEINLQALSQVQIPFQYSFACPMDPTVLAEFNMISEPSLYERPRAPGTDKVKPEWKTSYDAFALKNHMMTLEDAYAFMECFPPSNYPAKLLSPTGKFTSVLKRATNAGEEGPTPTELYNHDERLTDYNPNISELLNSGNYNRYNGMMSASRNYGQPYIVEGNKLMFL